MSGGFRIRCAARLSWLVVAVACDLDGDTLDDPLDDTLATEPAPGTDADPGRSAGEIVFVEERGPPNFRVGVLDIPSGEVHTAFALPAGAFAYDLDVERTSGAVALAYTAPAADGEDGFDRSQIVRLVDGEPHWVAGPDEADAWAVSPRWSADGTRIWYVARDPSLVARGVGYALVLADVASGRVVHSIDWAAEPAVSPTGEYVAWVAVDPGTQVRSIQLGDADGALVRRLVEGDAYADVAHPVFSADGAEVFVFVPELGDVPRVAELWADPSPLGHGAHITAGDWLAIPLDGSSPRRVTALATIQYGAAVSPDGGSLVSATQTGIEWVSLHDGASEELLFNRAIRSLGYRTTAGD